MPRILTTSSIVMFLSRFSKWHLYGASISCLLLLVCWWVYGWYLPLCSAENNLLAKQRYQVSTSNVHTIEHLRHKYAELKCSYEKLKTDSFFSGNELHLILDCARRYQVSCINVDTREPIREGFVIKHQYHIQVRAHYDDLYSFLQAFYDIKRPLRIIEADIARNDNEELDAILTIESARPL